MKQADVSPEMDAEAGAEVSPQTGSEGVPESASPTRPIRGWVIALVAAVALVAVALAAWSWTRPDPVAAEDSGRAAQQVAERAVVAVLAYDYRTLDQNEKDAQSYLTARYDREQFAPLWATVKKNAPASKTVITATAVGSGIVRTAPDRVQVLVLVDRPTSNAGTSAPVTYQDHVTVTMVKVGGRWLIDGLTTD